MNVANSLSSVQAMAALSSIRSANKQPELALQLLLKSLELAQSGASAQSPTTESTKVAAPSETGTLLDILA